MDLDLAKLMAANLGYDIPEENPVQKIQKTLVPLNLALASNANQNQINRNTRDLTRLAMAGGFLSGRPDALNEGMRQALSVYGNQSQLARDDIRQTEGYLQNLQVAEIKKQQQIMNALKAEELNQHRQALEEQKANELEWRRSDSADKLEERKLAREDMNQRAAAALAQRAYDLQAQRDNALLMERERAANQRALHEMTAAVAAQGKKDPMFESAISQLKDDNAAYQKYLDGWMKGPGPIKGEKPTPIKDFLKLTGRDKIHEANKQIVGQKYSDMGLNIDTPHPGDGSVTADEEGFQTFDGFDGWGLRVNPGSQASPPVVAAPPGQPTSPVVQPSRPIPTPTPTPTPYPPMGNT